VREPELARKDVFCEMSGVRYLLFRVRLFIVLRLSRLELAVVVVSGPEAVKDVYIPVQIRVWKEVIEEDRKYDWAEGRR
jgi:hypothetical protein